MQRPSGAGVAIAAAGRAAGCRRSFLAGITFADPATGQLRVFDELGRRKLDLEGLVCPGAPALAGTSLRKGIDRVH